MAEKSKFDPRALMEKAIEVMKASVAERRDDGKVSPYVGAVLYKADGKIETACRGEIREGDHAEFTLLERKNRSEPLDGSILFATLEPCAPGARTPPKLSCSERIVNARIAGVYVGITDPDPDVDRKGLEFLERSGIKVHMFDRDLQDVIREVNAEFLEQALSRAEDRESQAEQVILSPLEGAATNTDFDDFSPNALDSYLRRIGLSEGASSESARRRLLRQGLVEEGDGVFTPSGFGMLLLGDKPRDRFQQAGLLATVIYPNGKQEVRNFDEPYVLIPKLLEDWLRKVLPLTIDRSQMERVEEIDVPFEMIREAVVNALVHRDYDIEGAKCQLIIDADTIVVKSPGAPVHPITMEQMKSFTAPMLSRNPKLHYVFAQIDAAEERGFGLSSLKNRSAELGLPRPSFSFDDPYLVLTIYRTPESAVRQVSGDALAALNRNQRRGFEWLLTKGPVTAAEYEAALDISRSTAHNHLNDMIKKGLVVRQGEGPSTLYEAYTQ